MAAVTLTGARAQIVDAAERLFGERGIAGVSLREVGAAAGQRNNSAAQYHFGDKDGLVGAIFERRMTPIDRRRRAMLAESDGSISFLVRSIVEPLHRAPARYRRFLQQLSLGDPQFRALGALDRPEMTGLKDAFERLDAALAARGLPADVRGERLRLLGVLVVHATPSPHFVDALVALLEAPDR
jgi:AcrR family transcriptional regulator